MKERIKGMNKNGTKEGKEDEEKKKYGSCVDGWKEEWKRGKNLLS